MSKLRIKDAPLLPNVNGTEKIPTGGRGDYSVSLEQVKTFARGGIPQQIEDHINDTENPHQVGKSQVGLGEVDNTSDIDKPISTATQEALDLKADKTAVHSKSATLPTYYTKEAGVNPVTGVANGAYFNVRSSSDESYIDEYQNVGGSAVVTGKRYLSALGVESQEKPASTVKDASGKWQQEINDEQKALNLAQGDVNKSLMPDTQTKDSFKNAYSTKNANLFEQLRAMSACGRCYVWKNPLHAGQENYRFSVGINMSGFKTAEWKFVADADNFIRMEYGYTGAIRSPTGFTDATNRVGTVSGGSGNNVYFATVDSSFDLVFTGTGLLINQYVDANGGIFDVYLDGVLLRTMSANINNPENAGAVALNIQKLVVSDLANTTHTVKFVFKGADPLYPPTTSARGWFKNFTGSDTHTAAIIAGGEMGMSPTGAKLVANGIIDFAISSRAFGTSMPYDWTPSHSGAAGAMVVHSRKMYIDNTLVDDALTVVSSEKEFKELTIIQKYTAYNSNDTAKAYPLYDGTLITKFDRVNGLSYAHELETRNKLDVSEGFMPMLSGRRTSDLLKFEADNGQTVDLSGANPAADIQTYTGVLKSARWLGNNTGLAISVDSPEASSSLGKSYSDSNPTMFNERTDGFCKLYFKTMDRNSVVEAGTKFVTRHKVWLANF